MVLGRGDEGEQEALAVAQTKQDESLSKARAVGKGRKGSSVCPQAAPESEAGKGQPQEAVGPQTAFLMLNSFWLALNIHGFRTITQREETGRRVNSVQLLLPPPLPPPTGFSPERTGEGCARERSIWLPGRPIPSRAGAAGSSLEITTIENGESFFSFLFTALSQSPHLQQCRGLCYVCQPHCGTRAMLCPKAQEEGVSP